MPHWQCTYEQNIDVYDFCNHNFVRKQVNQKQVNHKQDNNQQETHKSQSFEFCLFVKRHTTYMGR